MSVEFTRLLAAAREGGAEAVDRLYASIYPELHVLARRQLAGSRDGTLSPTAVVHEAYLKLAGAEHCVVSDRRHFLAVSARIMRQVIVDYARARQAGKRGSNARPVTLDEGGLSAFGDLSHRATMLDLDDALKRLAEAESPPRSWRGSQTRMSASV